MLAVTISQSGQAGVSTLFVVSSACLATLFVWHECLHHISNFLVHRVLQSENIRSNKDASTIVCSSCELVKSYKLDFVSKHVTASIAFELL